VDGDVIVTFLSSGRDLLAEIVRYDEHNQSQSPPTQRSCIWPILNQSHRCCSCSILHQKKKAALSQRWPRDVPYIWMPWKISGVPSYAHGYFSRNC